ncbi:MAG: AMP-binding protein [Eubacteriales bacterium]
MLPVGYKNLGHLLDFQANKDPNKTFLIFEDNQENVQFFTWQEFNLKINRLANSLLELGIGKGDRVNVHLTNCPEFFLSWFALAKIGAVMVPTNPVSTAYEMEYILGHSESVAVITEPLCDEVIFKVKPVCPNLKNIILARTGEVKEDAVLFEDILNNTNEEMPQVEVGPLDEAAMLYTSGTTARPKGVLITHANYIWTGNVMSKHMRLTPDERQFIVLPLFHGNAQYYSTMSALYAGASIAFTERFSASRYFKQANKYDATVASLFAAPMRMLLNQPARPGESKHKLRLALFAITVTEKQLKVFEERFNLPLLQIYGMTETLATPLLNPIDGIIKNMGIGLPALGYDVKVVDEHGNALPAGKPGEIILKGEPGITIMKGYFKNPEATAAAIKDGWLYTGDNAFVDEDGYFYFVDRSKDMFKRAGENVAASEVESVINQHPAVYESAVVSIPDPIRDEAIKAFVILRENQNATEEEIIKFCAERLVKFKVPGIVEFVNEFPRTSVGKIQKHILCKREDEKNNAPGN